MPVNTSNSSAVLQWDIFCKVVDNFGDIGVCWRLARQLAHEHGLQVRLFVDDLQVVSKIITTINFNKNSQLIDNIEIINFNFKTKPADVVIEAFACGLPAAYQNLMTESTIWVNLEYLSAENWVADFHAKHSRVGDLTRHFFFPGFTKNTGGLLRERDLIAQRDTYLQTELHENELKISLFCYENAPLQALFHAAAGDMQKTTIYAPFTDSIHQIASFFGKEKLRVGDVLTKNMLTLRVLPFLSQTEYDELLWTCDLNFVRGEDSWVRAIWAGKPFIWQPYVQSENTHITKLNAFLDVFYSENASACEAHRYWSSGQWSNQIWQRYLDNLPAIQISTLQQSKKLSEYIDLAAQLITFCNA